MSKVLVKFFCITLIFLFTLTPLQFNFLYTYKYINAVDEELVINENTNNKTIKNIIVILLIIFLIVISVFIFKKLIK